MIKNIRTSRNNFKTKIEVKMKEQIIIQMKIKI